MAVIPLALALICSFLVYSHATQQQEDLLPFAEFNEYSQGGGQGYMERVMESHRKHGAPSHPLHNQRDTVKSGTGKASFTIKMGETRPFSHFFETSVGSGHMSLTLRQDWREHLTMAQRDLGVKHIRGHGLLDDDMSVSFGYQQHAFYNVDSLVEFLMSINMRPIFELSFMPTWLTSGNHTVCHYKGNSDPPKNFSQWGELIGALGQHLVSKHGEDVASEFFFEVWNEPNDHFWRGTQAQYFQLYQEAAMGLKNASDKLQVGGPATCCPDCWISDFVNFTTTQGVPFDFISSHAYASCSMSGLGSVDKVAGELMQARSNLDNVTKGKNVPWLVTEFGDNCAQGIGSGSNYFPSAIHDMIDQSSFTIAAVDRLAGPGEPTALSYWAISDVFEEDFFPIHNESFHGAFGLVNLHGIPKPTYRAYQLLHETGDTQVVVERPPTPQPQGTCGTPVVGMDIWGGDISMVAGNFSIEQCCDLCKNTSNCDIAEIWHVAAGTEGYRCALKSWAGHKNVTSDSGRTYVNVTKLPFTDDELCAKNTGVLAVMNGSSQIDVFVYNHASFVDDINTCNVTVEFSQLSVNHFDLGQIAQKASIRRIDETHANPLMAWIDMGMPDYTTNEQNAAILNASQLVTEPFLSVATVESPTSFSMTMSPHSVAVLRFML
eukprot:m.67388 g.67388  ORF g.67388 m.67388 type:complete len:661 (+) comp11885_c0_seq2:62-2044(+)